MINENAIDNVKRNSIHRFGFERKIHATDDNARAKKKVKKNITVNGRTRYTVASAAGIEWANGFSTESAITWMTLN